MIDMNKIGGQYQPITKYELVSGGNTDHPRPGPRLEEARRIVEQTLRDAGFHEVAPGGTWVHVAQKRTARICTHHPVITLKKGELIDGTIGIEMWHQKEPLAILGWDRAKELGYDTTDAQARYLESKRAFGIR